MRRLPQVPALRGPDINRERLVAQRDTRQGILMIIALLCEHLHWNTNTANNANANTYTYNVIL